MGTSLLIARLFGIPVRLHWTFLLLAFWLVSTHYSFGGTINWVDMGWTLASVTALFLCVLLHEMGHALTARRYGVNTQKILLLPIGGLAMLDQLPDKPRQEMWVAAAGPLANLALAFVLLPVILLMPGNNLETILGYWLYPKGNYFIHDASRVGYLLVGLVALNVLVALFNLIPAFPMDGGRIFRALLATHWSRLQATTIAVRTGQAIAIVLVALSIPSFNWLMALAAAFIFFSAAFELKMIREDHLLKTHTVGDAARRSFGKIYTTHTVAEAEEMFRYGAKDEYLLVFDEWQNFAGMLDSTSLPATAEKEKDRWSTLVGNTALLHPPCLITEDNLHQAAQMLSGTDFEFLPVSDRNGSVVAVFNSEILNRYIQKVRKGKLP
ncbi:MAG: site-2 protease family protein [Saprospiraceae bacterium]|nr:site-2 protease family protein [Saprospiraceae bacterium]